MRRSREGRLGQVERGFGYLYLGSGFKLPRPRRRAVLAPDLSTGVFIDGMASFVLIKRIRVSTGSG